MPRGFAAAVSSLTLPSDPFSSMRWLYVKIEKKLYLFLTIPDGSQPGFCSCKETIAVEGGNLN